LFLVEAVPAVLFGGILWFWLRDWPKDAPWLSPVEKQNLAEAYEAELKRKESHRHYTVGQALCDGGVLRLCLIYFLWITGFWGYNYWMPTVLREASGWSSVRIGWMIVIPMTLALAGMVFVGSSSSRTGEKRWHGAAPMFIAAVGMGFGSFVRDPFWSFILVCVAGVGVYSAFGVWWSYPTTFLSGTAAAGAIGLINSCGNVGGFLGPYLTGLMRDLTGSVHSAYVYLAGSLLGAGLLMLRLRFRDSQSALAK
jgi:ACS family tartrate transporter-like MFS transporter